MLSPEQIETTKATRRVQLNDEQLLCNEALASGQFDAISDDEWVALCEKVAAKAGKTAPVVTGGED